MLRAILRNSGIHPCILFRVIRGWARYAMDRKRFRKLMGTSDSRMAWGRELPILTECDESAGSVGFYFLQDQLVARWIHEAKPDRHIDVGSRVDGFIGSLSVFREVEVLDIRPQPHPIPGVRFHQRDLMEPLSAAWQNCTDSLSCLHTIEHFGLGRYGDPLDPDGHIKGLQQLKRMVRPGGRIYLSTPIGPERIEFNAHRVFSANSLIHWFETGWEIQRFAIIDDECRLRESVDWNGPDVERHFGCTLGLGIIVARRSSS